MDIEKMMIDFSEYLKGKPVQNERDTEKYLLKYMEERNIDSAEVLCGAVDSDEFGIYNDEVYEYLELAEKRFKHKGSPEICQKGAGACSRKLERGLYGSRIVRQNAGEPFGKI